MGGFGTRYEEFQWEYKIIGQMTTKTLPSNSQRCSNMQSKPWVSFLLILAACTAPSKDVSSYNWGFPFDSFRYKGEQVEMSLGGLDPVGLFFNLCLWFLVFVFLQKIFKKMFVKKQFLITILAFLHIYSFLYVFSTGFQFALSELVTEKSNNGYIIYAAILFLCLAIGLLFWSVSMVTYKTQRRSPGSGTDSGMQG
jgi:hypothetical protein